MVVYPVRHVKSRRVDKDGATGMGRAWLTYIAAAYAGALTCDSPGARRSTHGSGWKTDEVVQCASQYEAAHSRQ